MLGRPLRGEGEYLVTEGLLRVLLADEQSLFREAVKVVLTNHANTEYENLSRRLGADRFFDKSSETWEAVTLIHNLAANKRRGDAPPATRP